MKRKPLQSIRKCKQGGKKEGALKEQADAEAAGMITVGANGKDATSSAAAGDLIQKNLDSQSSSTPAGI